MIQSITFHRGKGLSREYAYIKEIKPLVGKKISFTPGLNIVIGPNGAGKSTLLNAVADCLAARQGGASVVTETWMRERFGLGINPHNEISLPATVVHDGQPVVYQTCSAVLLPNL